MLAQELELREPQEGNNTRTISGYAVKWEQLSGKLGWMTRFQEKFLRGAFADSIQGDSQKMLWNHNTDMVVGSTKSGTLRITEDEVGLRFENDLPESDWGNNVYQAIKRGDVDGVSFGFKMLGEEWDETDPDNLIRSVTKAKLFEVSPTPFPAYPQSEVQARTIDTVYAEYREANKPEPVTKTEDEKLAEQRKELSKVRLKLYEEGNN